MSVPCSVDHSGLLVFLFSLDGWCLFQTVKVKKTGQQVTYLYSSVLPLCQRMSLILIFIIFWFLFHTAPVSFCSHFEKCISWRSECSAPETPPQWKKYCMFVFHVYLKNHSRIKILCRVGGNINLCSLLLWILNAFVSSISRYLRALFVCLESSCYGPSWLSRLRRDHTLLCYKDFTFAHVKCKFSTLCLSKNSISIYSCCFWVAKCHSFPQMGYF